MDSYEKMEEEIHEFKKYMKMTMDLLCDAKKWKLLSEYTDNVEAKEKYKRISNTLYDMFKSEHDNIGMMFKGQ